eukprot:Pgem_evm2s19777
MDEVTKNYTALVINNTVDCNHWSETIYFYKASPVPETFKFGSMDFWAYHYARILALWGIIYLAFGAVNGWYGYYKGEIVEQVRGVPVNFTWSMILAKCSAQLITYHTMILLLLMSRKTIFTLKTSFRGKLTQYIPLDYTIDCHSFVGIVYFILVLIHIAGHIGNVIVLTENENFMPNRLGGELQV